LDPAGTGMLTAEKKVLPDPGKGAVACHWPLTYSAVLQVCWLDWRLMNESGGMVELCTPLMVTMELVKLTRAEEPENLGLKAALSQTTSPAGTDWLLKWVEKQTWFAQGVVVGVVVVMDEVVDEVDEEEVVVVVDDVGDVVVDDVVYELVGGK
jgi:hypothetical protein